MYKPEKPIDRMFDKSYVIVTAHRGYSSSCLLYTSRCV